MMIECGIRGCCAKVRSSVVGLRYCAQEAIVWDRFGRGYCYYHNPDEPHKFGEGYDEKRRAQEKLAQDAQP